MTYNNPPIQEALVDIRVTYKNFDVELVEALHEKVEDKLPVKNARSSTSFRFKKDSAEVEEPVVDGYMFKAPDDSQILQVTREGFTFSIVNSYSSWDEFYELTYFFWELFVEELNPIDIKRVGLRYINRLELPINIDELSNYVATRFDLGSIEEKPRELFVRFVLPYDNQTCIVTHATNPNLLSDDSRGYIIDIDAFTENTISATDTEKLENALNKLREIKNDIFEKSITDKTRELFQ